MDAKLKISLMLIRYDKLLNAIQKLYEVPDAKMEASYCTRPPTYATNTTLRPTLYLQTW
jgi:hypothetical protein